MPNPTNFPLAATKEQVQSSSERIAHFLGFVPDDRLTWTPSPTSRSALRLAAHCALVNTAFARILSKDMPDPMPSPERFFEELHAGEERFSTRDLVAEALRESTTDLLRAIDAMDASSAEDARNSPFGAFPTRFWLGQSADHLVAHAGQLAYLQTIWGDLDNHMS